VPTSAPVDARRQKGYWRSPRGIAVIAVAVFVFAGLEVASGPFTIAFAGLALATQAVMIPLLALAGWRWWKARRQPRINGAGESAEEAAEL
jgi:hypothetical protein